MRVNKNTENKIKHNCPRCNYVWFNNITTPKHCKRCKFKMPIYDKKAKRLELESKIEWELMMGLSNRNREIIRRGILQRKKIIAKDKEWSISVQERDGYKCVECGSRFKLQAHHIQPKSKYPELRHDLNNGITLCILCHAEKHPEVAPMQKDANYYRKYLITDKDSV